jgi:hypothetical protein
MVDLLHELRIQKEKKTECLLCIKFYLKLFSFLGMWYYDFLIKLECKIMFFYLFEVIKLRLNTKFYDKLIKYFYKKSKKLTKKSE